MPTLEYKLKSSLCSYCVEYMHSTQLSMAIKQTFLVSFSRVEEIKGQTMRKLMKMSEKEKMKTWF